LRRCELATGEFFTPSPDCRIRSAKTSPALPPSWGDALTAGGYVLPQWGVDPGWAAAVKATGGGTRWHC